WSAGALVDDDDCEADGCVAAVVVALVFFGLEPAAAPIAPSASSATNAQHAICAAFGQPRNADHDLCGHRREVESTGPESGPIPPFIAPAPRTLGRPSRRRRLMSNRT